jgi:hypothetical protein
VSYLSLREGPRGWGPWEDIGSQGRQTRDNARKNQVSLAAKAAACVVLFIVCVAMLFYLYLFSIRQTVGAQKAWLNSFLLLEIVCVSTGLVLFDHRNTPVEYAEGAESERSDCPGSTKM